MKAKLPSSVVVVAVLAAVLLVGSVLRLTVIDWYRIPQNGMSPGLPAGSLLFVNKLAYSTPGDVRRGDVVVFIRVHKGRSYNFIWRVIGLPGDAIEAAGEALSINGEPVTRTPLREDSDRVVYVERSGDAEYEVAYDRSPGELPQEVALTVPSDHFFLMGDNRYGAMDSRATGPVAFTAFVGRKL